MQVILIAAMSLNGKIAAAENQSSLEWTSKEDTKFFVEKTKECGVMIMGRKTFETIGKPLKGRRIVVMTKNPPPLRVIPPLPEGEPACRQAGVWVGREEGGLNVDSGIVDFTNKPPRIILTDLEAQGYTSVAITGGAGVYSMFLKEKLVTDVYLTIEPILFGKGIGLAEWPSTLTRYASPATNPPPFTRGELEGGLGGEGGVGSDVRLELVETRMLGEQSVMVHYYVKK